MKNLQKVVEDNDHVKFVEETDRVYYDTPSQLSITDGAAKRQYIIQKDGLSDAIVWNPWIAKVHSATVIILTVFN